MTMLLRPRKVRWREWSGESRRERTEIRQLERTGKPDYRRVFLGRYRGNSPAGGGGISETLARRARSRRHLIWYARRPRGPDSRRSTGGVRACPRPGFPVV